MLSKLAATTARRLGPHRFSQARYEQAVDRLVVAYVEWREESVAVREAYSRCDTTRGRKPRHAFAVYLAALDREERAAAEYAACVEQVYALISRHARLFVTARADAASARARPCRPTGRL